MSAPQPESGSPDLTAEEEKREAPKTKTKQLTLLDMTRKTGDSQTAGQVTGVTAKGKKVQRLPKKPPPPGRTPRWWTRT